ncbi:MAG: dihydrodipicolinate synthase family protein [Candidatus Bipolaricaulis sp.]|nr:dihydrodipicolinate synthase family protein [Candidatus Bipolaricaulis sp.]MDD5645926.1 dihydrodipicolinate synthase family protein [Candidatus Bipolaricaulis sp.]
MSRNLEDLKGILPPIPTPFDRRGSFARDRLRDNFRVWNRHALAGFVVLGSNGEGVLLSSEERLDVLRAAREDIPETRWMIAGTGCPSTRETVELTRHAARIGADAALVLPPSYYRGRMTREALVRHYAAVGDASEIPVLIYNMPACTGIDLDAGTIAAVAAHPNVVGIKDSGGDVVKMGAIVGSLGSEFRVFAGSAGFLLPALAVGAVGGVLALANIAPAECLAIYDHFVNGRAVEAAELQRRMIPVNTAVTSRWGVAGLKAAMDILGWEGGPVRAPLVDLTPPEVEELASILELGGLEKEEEGGR